MRSAIIIVLSAGLAVAMPARRAVTELNQAATEEAHQRDDTATRAFSNVQIKTADGKCLFVDKLSGDFRANLTPVQVATCGTTDGQGWDVITSGKHNDQQGQALIVSTLTQACLNFDPRRQPGDQVNLFSCGGRADGGGQVTNSQLFAFNGQAGPVSLVPENGQQQCLSSKAQRIDIAACANGAQDQSFTFGGAVAGNGTVNNGGDGGNGNGNQGNGNNGQGNGNQGNAGGNQGNGNGNGNGNGGQDAGNNGGQGNNGNGNQGNGNQGNNNQGNGNQGNGNVNNGNQGNNGKGNGSGNNSCSCRNKAKHNH